MIFAPSPVPVPRFSLPCDSHVLPSTSWGCCRQHPTLPTLALREKGAAQHFWYTYCLPPLLPR
eukprot:9384575-Prorocentrum_lima.AAC.1